MRRSSLNLPDGALGSALALLLACALPLAVLLFSYIGVTDDAYISYRYAHNLAEGRGLVFNSGERVEGFTSLLWTLMMAVPEALGLRVHIFAALLSLAFALLALVISWLICRRLGVSFWGTTAAVVLLGLYPAYWLTVTNGLEGGLLAFLLTCTIYLTLCERAGYAGLCGGLLFATRPDSLLVIPICALYLLVASEKPTMPENPTMPFRRRSARLLLSLIAPWFALVAAITLWRLVYYGAWLPNTITAKSMPLSDLDIATLKSNIVNGLRYWLGFLVSALPLSVGAALAPVVAPRRPATWLYLAVLATQVPIVLANGGDWMAHHRLLAVYAPLMSVLLGLTLDGITVDIRALGSVSQLAICFYVGVLLVLGSVFMSRADSTVAWAATPDFSIEQDELCWAALAGQVQPALLPADRVSPEALGTFSYMIPNVYSHDMFGLTNRYVASHGFYIAQWGKFAPAYTYRVARPNLIVVQNDFNFLSYMARASNGTYNDRYSTYSLQKSNLPGCQAISSETFLISIRKDSVARILPTFAGLGARPVTVPK